MTDEVRYQMYRPSQVRARRDACPVVYIPLGALPPKGAKLVGVMGSMPPQDATADYGRRTLEEAARVIGKEVAHRLTHTELYKGHGAGLQEGLWRKDSERDPA